MYKFVEKVFINSVNKFKLEIGLYKLHQFITKRVIGSKYLAVYFLR